MLADPLLPSLSDQREEAGAQFHPHRRLCPALPLQSHAAHVLPDGFQRLRHYGFLSHRYRSAKLALCRRLLGVTSTDLAPPPDKLDFRDLYEKLTGKSLRECPVCHAGHMVAIAVLPAAGRAPPLSMS